MKITFWAGSVKLLVWTDAPEESAKMIGDILLNKTERFLRIGDPGQFQFINLDNVTNVVMEEDEV